MALLLLLSFLLPQPVYTSTAAPLKQDADSLVARNWTVQDGLPVNSVNQLIQDKDGFIWFTTYDGIVRFDGVQFKVFTHSNTPNMTQNRAVYIYEQKGTGIWVSLENGGLGLINDKGFTHFGAREGFVHSDVTTIFEDSRGTMWFGTYDGLYTYEDGIFTRAFVRDDAIQNRISAIYEAEDGTIWAGTFDGLVHLSNDGLKVYGTTPGRIQNEMTLIHRNNEGKIWIGARTGIYTLKNGQLVHPTDLQAINNEYVAAVYNYDGYTLVSTDRGLYKYKQGNLQQLDSYNSQYKSFQHFFTDSRGILWMIKNDGSVAWLIDGTIVPFETKNKLSEYHFNRITEDREGNMWLTTARHGIVRIKHASARMIGTKEGLTGGNILGIFEDSRGRFWVGTRDQGLNIIDGDRVQHLKEGQNISSDVVQSIAEDKKGNVWVGYYQQGLQRFSDGKVKSFSLGYDSRINDVHAIFVSSDSTIWVGTYGGLVKFDPDKKNQIVYTIRDGLAGNLVRYIDEDPEGGLWIGTADGGVSRYIDGQFTNYTTDEGLSSNNIRSVYVDEYNPNTIWIGTENSGLNRIRNGKITHLGVKEGLPDHIVHYISQDKRGWLWMSSNRGVFKIKKETLNDFLDGKETYFRMVAYGREEGMRNPECNGSFQQGGLRTSRGTFWFSTQEGVAIFKINPKFKNDVPPNVFVRHVIADGQTYAPEKANIQTGVNDFKVDFRALTFATPERTHFRYKLEGYETKWHQVTNKREISYHDIPNGKYTFRVLAANNQGVWSPRGAVAAISINPIFYERPWFYLLLGLLLVLGYYGASRARYHHLIERQKRLKDIIDEQTAKLRRERDAVKQQNEIIEKQAEKLEESNKTKDRFFSIIGHDLRNPFQALIGYSSLILDDYESMDRVEIKTSIEEMQKASHRLLNLVENLLHWASLQTGKVKPNPEEFCLAEVLDANVQLVLQSANQKEITLQAHIDERLPIYGDRNMLSTVIRNLLSNAVKFTNRGGEIKLKAENRVEVLIISVSDTGIGMSEKMLRTLMDLDSNVSRQGTENESGTGLGLIICKEMIELHGGGIAVESTKGEGTTFVITLPKEGLRSKDLG